MDVSEYRKEYAQKLERAAQERKERRAAALQSRGGEEDERAGGSGEEPTEEDEIRSTVSVIQDREEDPGVRAATLQSAGIHVSKSHDLIDMAIGVLRDKSEPVEVRLSALRVLQQSSFRAAIFNPKRPEYMAALREVVDDPNQELREQALELLAQEKDEYAQRRLLEGLRDPSKALVPVEKAIQLLGYDVHAEQYPILREIVRNSPSPEAKREAVRLLASDPGSKDLLVGLLRDKSERADMRNASAIALQSLAPQDFEREAKRIALDESEDPELRATCISAISRFSDQEALSQDPEFSRGIEELGDQSHPADLAHAIQRYIADRRKP